MAKSKSKKKLSSKKISKISPIVVGKIEPKHVELIAAVEEPHILVAVPKSTWEKFIDFLTGGS